MILKILQKFIRYCNNYNNIHLYYTPVNLGYIVLYLFSLNKPVLRIMNLSVVSRTKENIYFKVEKLFIVKTQL